MFDVDGTLFDTLPSLTAAANELLARANLEPVQPAQLRASLSEGLMPLFREALALQARPPEAGLAAGLEADFLLHYERHWLAEAGLFPGARECLSTLQARGFALGICSNRDRASTSALLTSAGVTARFDAVIGLGDAPLPKPAADPLLLAVQRLGVAPSQVLFVGDSAMDSRCAHAAGVPFAAHLHGYASSSSDLLPQIMSFDAYEQLSHWLLERQSTQREQIHA